MKRALGVAFGIAAAAVVGAGGANAQGLEFLHSQRTEGARVCFNDHFHTGTSGGHASKQEAERAAISSWSGFTAWEYGDRWGSWRLAGSKSVNCANPTGSWGCQVEARPCRPLTGGDPGRRRARPGAAKKQ
jgi:hypothetical protein